MSVSRCIVILSAKSSGSSACQRWLTRLAGARHVAHTRHYESETLYWVKAASLLGEPQAQMLDSEVPIPRARARADLEALLGANVPGFELPRDDRTLVFEGWRALCLAHAPLFIEKSPHHLMQRSSLELLRQAIEMQPEIEVFSLGLVRNPMDTLYSAYRRWRTPPERAQYEWLRSYENLRDWVSARGEAAALVRYEDLVAGPQVLKPALRFAGVEDSELEDAPRDFDARSLGRWREDDSFGFQLAPAVRELAKQYGYREEELFNEPHPAWPLRRTSERALHLASRPLRRWVHRFRAR